MKKATLKVGARAREERQPRAAVGLGVCQERLDGLQPGVGEHGERGEGEDAVDAGVGGFLRRRRRRQHAARAAAAAHPGRRAAKHRVQQPPHPRRARAVGVRQRAQAPVVAVVDERVAERGLARGGGAAVAGAAAPRAARAAPAAPHLLHVLLHGAREAGVDDGVDAGDVDAHAKGDGGDDGAHAAGRERGGGGGSRARGQPRVIRRGLDLGRHEGGGDGIGGRLVGDVDDGAGAALEAAAAREERDHRAPRRGAADAAGDPGCCKP